MDRGGGGCVVAMDNWAGGPVTKRWMPAMPEVGQVGTRA